MNGTERVSAGAVAAGAVAVGAASAGGAEGIACGAMLKLAIAWVDAGKGLLACGCGCGACATAIDGMPWSGGV